MGIETRSTDAKGRISLPRAFANATVIVEHPDREFHLYLPLATLRDGFHEGKG